MTSKQGGPSNAPQGKNTADMKLAIVQANLQKAKMAQIEVSKKIRNFNKAG